MKKNYVIFALIMIFQNACAWWAAAARGIEPIILSFGAAFAAIGLRDQSSHDVQLFAKKKIQERFWSEHHADEHIEVMEANRDIFTEKEQKELYEEVAAYKKAKKEEREKEAAFKEKDPDGYKKWKK